MDAKRFDALARSLEDGFPRRAALGTTLGVGLSSLLSRFGIKDAASKKKKRKKKKCKGGKKKCGKKCCVSSDVCLDGKCCPADQACGTACCDQGLICGDPEAGVYVVGQGTCPVGVSTCGSVDPIFCNGTDGNSDPPCACFQSTDGATRCGTPIDEVKVADCGHCETDADCEQLFPDVIGVFCGANAIGLCGCQPGQNLCGAPCPVV